VPLQANLPPLTDPIVAEVIAQMQQQLDAQSEQLNAASQQLDAQQKQRQADVRELAYAQLKIQILEERLRKMRIAKYGKASEKLSDLQLDLLELEPGVSSEEV
jgi:transposase